MSLVEIARFTDVYEADLAAAFLASHGIEVSVTERFQTTVDPLMQRALGIRLMGAEARAAEARSLLARAQAGEFAQPDEDDLEPVAPATRTAATLMALAAFPAGGFWGTSLPRRFRPLAWQGMLLSAILLAGGLVAAWALGGLIGRN